MKDKFTAVHTAKDIILTSLTLLVGVAMGIFGQAGMAVLGYTIILCGIFMLIFYKTGHKCADDNKLYHKLTLYYGLDEFDPLSKMISSDKITKAILPKDKQCQLMLEIYYNQTTSIFQLFKYVPNTYEVAVDAVKHSAEEAKLFLKK